MRWPTIPLGELSRPRQWPILPKSEMVASGYPLFGANGEIGFAPEYTHEHPTLIVGCRGSCGSLHITPRRSYVNGNAMALDALKSERIDLSFLFRFLQRRGFADVISGSSQPQITGQNIARVEVPLPPLDEQRRIAAILDQADALRRKRNATIQRAERFIEASFTEQFGPGTGQTETASLGDLFEITRGGSPRPIDSYLTDNDDGLNWISISDATANGKFISKVKRRIKPSGASKSRRVEPGDFLLTNSMSFGRPYIMATTGYIHDGWLSLRSKDARISQEYLYRALSAPETYAKFSQLASGATVKNLNIDLVRAVRIPVPNRDRQDCFARVATAVDADIERKRRSLHKLDALFAALQHSAFNGELTRSAEPVLHSA